MALGLSPWLLTCLPAWSQAAQPPAALAPADGTGPIWSPARPAGESSSSSQAGSSTLRLIQDGWGQTRPAEPAPSGSTALRWRSPQPADSGQKTGMSIPLQPANWQGRTSDSPSDVRTVSHEQAADPFQNPFGDLVAQTTTSQVELTAAQRGFVAAEPKPPAGGLPALDDLLPPLGGQADAPRAPADAPPPSPRDLTIPPAQPQQPAPPFEFPPAPAKPPTAEPKPVQPKAAVPQNGLDAPWLPAPAKPAPQQAEPEGADQPRLPLRTPAPYLPQADPVPYRERAAGDCQRIYNDRDCCQDDENCQAARLALKQNSIRSISLDITPALRPDAATLAEAREAELDQLRLMPARVWRDRSGRTRAEGRVTAFRYRRIEVEQADGSVEQISLGQLGDDELCFLAAYWRVPSECTLGDEQFAGRSWQPQTFTWTASALAHKPLYFEERQLERYGHTTGPLLEPVVSGAHFFLNVAVLPYKMGINPPNECQYPLGYYRPGSCAPWLLPPVPLSVRGGLLQAGTVTGLVFLIP